jgi:phosphoglycerate dehydrogenase-like enzyme
MKHVDIVLSADFLDESGTLIFPDIALETISGSPRVRYSYLDRYFAEYEPDQLCGADVLLSLKPKVTQRSLEGVSRLCAIGRFGVGYDNVDLAACTEHDIAVYITRQAVVRPVASSIVLLVLAASHNLVCKDRLIRRGDWVASTRVLGQEPRGRVLGTVGLGNIAREALRLLRPFEFERFLAFDPFVTSETADSLAVTLSSLEALFEQCDYVLINCPLTPETRGLIGESLLRRMKKDAVLVNTARGPIVDEAALAQVLSEGAIKCAALDTFEQEPLPSGSPLMGLENTILTSHSLCWTRELFRDMGREAFGGVLALLKGDVPAHVVNPAVLARPGFRRKIEWLAAVEVSP